MEKDKMKRYQEYLEFFHLSYELAEEENKKAFYETLEAGDYRM